VALLGGLLVAVIGVLLAPEPARVDRLTVVNPSPYEMAIDVRGPAGGGWLSLGFIEEGTTTDVQEVLDQGRAWSFRVKAQGREGGTFTLTRARLEVTGWRLTVPARITAALQAAGVPPNG
jgi:hypothetical protein